MSAHLHTSARLDARQVLTIVGLDALVLGAVALLTVVWFSERLAGVPLLWPLTALLFCAAGWLVGTTVGRERGFAARLPTFVPRPPRPETALCIVLAVLYRLPAVLHPWAFANAEAAYAGFPALSIRAGVRPGPVFAEGARYMGTLKGHLAAALSFLTRSSDFSLLLVITSLILYATFIAATMALARRISGRGAATAAGLYLALSPPFLTAFSVNCLGQYVDLLALGGLSLALLARVLDDDQDAGHRSRGRFLALGLALGLAVWQQPLAIVYLAVAVIALALRAARTREAWWLYAGAGFGLGLLPALIWNWEHSGATGAVVARSLTPLSEVPHVAARLLGTALPVLMGAGAGLPFGRAGALRTLASLVLLALLAAFAFRHRHALRDAAAGRPTPALLPALLVVANVALVLATIRGAQYGRPRYLLPVMAAVAISLGSATQWVAARRRILGWSLLSVLVLAGAVATLPRLVQAPATEGYYRRIIAALDDRGLRSGYADLSIAHPVTLFTAERVVLSPALGPTPAWESPRHARRLAQSGVDVLVLRPQDDARDFARRLAGRGLAFQSVHDPVPMFFRFSRPLTIEDLSAAKPRPLPEQEPVLP